MPQDLKEKFFAGHLIERNLKSFELLQSNKESIEGDPVQALKGNFVHNDLGVVAILTQSLAAEIKFSEHTHFESKFFLISNKIT